MSYTWRNLLILLICLSFLTTSSRSAQIFTTTRRLLTLADILGLNKFYEPTPNFLRGDSKNNSTFSLLVDPKTYANLTTFVTKTAYCLKKCSITNVVCIVFYGCTGQLVKFLTMVLIPLLVIIMIVACCTFRYWSCKCWLKYMFICTGVGFVIWLVTKCCCKNKKNRQLPRIQRMQVQ